MKYSKKPYASFTYPEQGQYAGFNSDYDRVTSKTNRVANKAIVAFVGLIVLMIVGIALVMLWPNTGDTQESVQEESLFDGMKNGALNWAIDTSGVKDKVESALLQHQDAIRNYTGMSSEEFATAMNGLAIQEWQATTLPDDSVSTDTIDLAALGVDAVVTTYEDPGYVTVSLYGQDVTMEVPESAQGYLPLLNYMQ